MEKRSPSCPTVWEKKTGCGESLWMVPGEFHGIWEIPLDGGLPGALMPSGFEKIHHGHATRAKNGVITFDALRFEK
jgi:hypothetical protein